MGATLMRGSNLVGEILHKRTWIGPAIGVVEKLIAKFIILPGIQGKSDWNRKQILKEIEETFNADDDSNLSHQDRHYKNRAKVALLSILGEMESDERDADLKAGFVDLKISSDLIAITEIISLGMVGNGALIAKLISSPLQLQQLFFAKLYPSCAPVVEAVVNRARMLRGGDSQEDFDELEHILNLGIRENKPPMLHDGLRCATVLTKLGTSIYGLSSLVGYLTKNALRLAAVEAVNAVSGFVYEVLPKKSNDEEIHSLLSALAESFASQKKTLPSENLQRYIDMVLQMSAPLRVEELPVFLQNHLAEQLIAKDPRLLSYIILSKLVDDDRNGTRRMEEFLESRWGLRPEVVRRWTDLANYYGPNTGFLKGFVVEALRI
jgi:hypothetical protein